MRRRGAALKKAKSLARTSPPPRSHHPGPREMTETNEGRRHAAERKTEERTIPILAAPHLAVSVRRCTAHPLRYKSEPESTDHGAFTCHTFQVHDSLEVASSVPDSDFAVPDALSHPGVPGRVVDGVPYGPCADGVPARSRHGGDGHPGRRDARTRGGGAGPRADVASSLRTGPATGRISSLRSVVRAPVLMSLTGIAGGGRWTNEAACTLRGQPDAAEVDRGRVRPVEIFGRHSQEPPARRG
jgi:hypothetical protein